MKEYIDAKSLIPNNSIKCSATYQKGVTQTSSSNMKKYLKNNSNTKNNSKLQL